MKYIKKINEGWFSKKEDSKINDSISVEKIYSIALEVAEMFNLRPPIVQPKGSPLLIGKTTFHLITLIKEKEGTWDSGVRFLIGWNEDKKIFAHTQSSPKYRNDSFKEEEDLQLQDEIVDKFNELNTK